MRGLFVAPALALALCLGVSSSFAQQFEKPGAQQAADILGPAVSGPGYRVNAVVYADGFLNLYLLETRYGAFDVQGTGLLRQRLHEINVLEHLDKLSQSDAFASAAVKAAIAPAEFAVKAVTRPVKTVRNTLSGVGRLFGNIGSALSAQGAKEDRPLATAVGVPAARRQIAFHFGVDAYTKFPPLRQRLDVLARAVAVGGLLPRIAYTFVPGGAGTAVSATQGANSLTQLLRDTPPAQLERINSEKLVRMGVSGKTISAFTRNPNYTPHDRTLFVGALERMRGVRNVWLLVERAARADSAAMAFFFRKRAEMILAYHGARKPLAAFASVAGVPVNVAGDGTVVAIFPFDTLTWSAPVAGLARKATHELRSQGASAGAELLVSGRVSAKARTQLEALGWTVMEGAH